MTACVIHRFCVAKLQQNLGYGPVPPWSSYRAGENIGQTIYDGLCRANRPGDLRALVGAVGFDASGRAICLDDAPFVSLLLRRNALAEPGRSRNLGFLVHVFNRHDWNRLCATSGNLARVAALLAFDADEITLPAVKHSNGVYRTLTVPPVSVAWDGADCALDGLRTKVHQASPYPDVPDRPPRKPSDPRWAVRVSETENAARQIAESWASLPETAMGVWIDLASKTPAQSPLA